MMEDGCVGGNMENIDLDIPKGAPKALKNDQVLLEKQVFTQNLYLYFSSSLCIWLIG